MRTTLTLLALVFLAQMTIAEGTDKFTIEELRELQKRTLVVEMPTLEEWLRVEDATALDGRGAAFIAHKSYLDNIEEVVRENWKFNDRVEFMTRSECHELFAQGSKDHLVMIKGRVGSFGIIGDYNLGSLDVLVFQRTDEPLTKDRKGQVELSTTALRTFPAGKYEDNRATGASQASYRVTYTRASLTFSIAVLDRSLRESLELGELHIFPGSATREARRNCKEMRGRVLTALSDNLDKGVSEDDLRKQFGGEVEFVTYDELMAHYLNKTEGKAVLLTLPSGVPTEGSQIMFRHIILDVATDRFIGISSGAGAMTSTLDYKKITFKKLAECE